MFKKHFKVLFAIAIFLTGTIYTALLSEYQAKGYTYYEAKNMVADKLEFLFPIYLLCCLLYYLYWKIKLIMKK